MDFFTNQSDINNNDHLMFVSYFTQINGYTPMELFALVVMENIKTNMYVVSSYGRVFSLNTKRELKQQTSDRSYRRVMLMNENNESQPVPVHRLVATMFIPKTQEDIYLGRIYVNHKDLTPNNNCIWNLEWVTAQENTIHARENGVYGRIIPFTLEPRLKGPARGEDVGLSRLTNDQVHLICQALSQGMDYPQCCKFAGLEDNMRNRNIICNIARGDRWQHISSEYDLNVDITTHNDYSSYIIPVCKLLEQGYRIIDIVQMLKIPGNYDRARMFVSGIKNRKTYKKLTVGFNF